MLRRRDAFLRSIRSKRAIFSPIATTRGRTRRNSARSAMSLMRRFQHRRADNRSVPYLSCHSSSRTSCHPSVTFQKADWSLALALFATAPNNSPGKNVLLGSQGSSDLFANAATSAAHKSRVSRSNSAFIATRERWDLSVSGFGLVVRTVSVPQDADITRSCPRCDASAALRTLRTQRTAPPPPAVTATTTDAAR